MDKASVVARSLKCPSCGAMISRGPEGLLGNGSTSVAPALAPIVARYTNEGGVQDGLDIAPTITEEAYLESHPEAEVARAFQILCSEGDVDGLAHILQACSDLEGEVRTLMQYQDPLSGMRSALHVAVENEQTDVVWLLLWMSSVLDRSAFPKQLVATVEGAGMSRFSTASDDDIRNLRDAQHQTAEDLARSQANWEEMVRSGILSP